MHLHPYFPGIRLREAGRLYWLSSKHREMINFNRPAGNEDARAAQPSSVRVCRACRECISTLTFLRFGSWKFWWCFEDWVLISHKAVSRVNSATQQGAQYTSCLLEYIMHLKIPSPPLLPSKSSCGNLDILAKFLREHQLQQSSVEWGSESCASQVYQIMRYIYRAYLHPYFPGIQQVEVWRLPSKSRIREIKTAVPNIVHIECRHSEAGYAFLEHPLCFYKQDAPIALPRRARSSQLECINWRSYQKLLSQTL
jgi:hypothetical protein